jgi:cytochrome c oxidase cbb3-type subunit IV
MDIDTLRGICTALALIAFIGVWIWAWSGKRKRAFDEAANLPFADDTLDAQSKGANHEK